MTPDNSNVFKGISNNHMSAHVDIRKRWKFRYRLEKKHTGQKKQTYKNKHKAVNTTEHTSHTLTNTES